MKWREFSRTASIVLVVLITTGCGNKAKQRIAMLEETNQDLGERLNRAVGDLNAATRQQDELDGQLQAAIRDVEQCRHRLAERREPVQPEAIRVVEPAATMIASEGKLFSAGKTTLRDQAQRTLDTIVSTIQSQYTAKDIIVFGHTDDDPITKSGWTDNWQLSTERALAVVRYFEARGIDPTRLVAAGGGQHRPLVENNSRENRATNRRVEIFAVEPRTLSR